MILPAACLIIMVGAVIAAIQVPANAASSSVVVDVNIPSAISLTDGCTSAPAHSLGTVLPGSTALTATGAGVCRYTFGSSNASSMLRMYQVDRSTQAMVGTPTSWTEVQGQGPTDDVAASGTSLLLALDNYSVNGHYERSIDGGATWAGFTPGGGPMTSITAASPTVAWRLGNGVVRLSTNMQNATPTWTNINPNLQGGGQVDPSDADAISATTVWVAGTGGVARTANAGATNWSITWTASCANPMQIDATSASTAFVASGGGCVPNDGLQRDVDYAAYGFACIVLGHRCACLAADDHYDLDRRLGWARGAQH